MEKRKRILKRVVLPIAAIFLTVMAIGILMGMQYLRDPGRVFKVDEDLDEAELAWRRQFDRDMINIVLLGFDGSEARAARYQIFRPDTIMIASLNYRTGDVALVNIPRDSYVKIHGMDIYDKINHAYMYGYNRSGAEDPHKSGIETTLKTIEDFLGGVPLHFYVSVNMDGVVEIVDRLGGIYYDVDVEVRTDYGRGRLLVEKGYQHLDGRKFLHYVRYRGDGGDFGRNRRQQQILIAAFEQLRKQGRLSDIPAVYRSLSENVETNLSVTQIASLALFGSRVDPGSIRTYIFPGSVQFAPRGGLDIAYVVIDERARVELIKEIFGVEVEQRPQITLPGPRRPREEIKEVEELPPIPSSYGPAAGNGSGKDEWEEVPAGDGQNGNGNNMPGVNGEEEKKDEKRGDGDGNDGGSGDEKENGRHSDSGSDDKKEANP